MWLFNFDGSSHFLVHIFRVDRTHHFDCGHYEMWRGLRFSYVKYGEAFVFHRILSTLSCICLLAIYRQRWLVLFLIRYSGFMNIACGILSQPQVMNKAQNKQRDISTYVRLSRWKWPCQVTCIPRANVNTIFLSLCFTLSLRPTFHSIIGNVCAIQIIQIKNCWKKSD